MKNLFTLLLALTVSFALVSCSKSEQAEPEMEESNSGSLTGYSQKLSGARKAAKSVADQETLRIEEQDRDWEEEVDQ